MRTTLTRSMAMVAMLLLFIALVGCQSTAVRSAKIYMQQDDPENAKIVLMEGAEVTPGDPELWYILGKVHSELDEWDEMNEAFAKSMELTDQFDSDIEVTRREEWRKKFNAGTTPFNEKNYEKAIPYFDTALKIRPDDSETHRLLASCYMQLENDEMAEKHFMRAIETAEDEAITARSFLLALYWNQQNYEQVIKVSDELVEVAGDKMRAEMPDRLSDAVQKKAIALNELDRFDDAIAAWDEAIATAPDNADFYFNKAILLHLQEDYDAAAVAYMKAIELNPSDYEARISAARALLGGEKYEDIVTVLEPWLFPDGTVSTEIVTYDKADPYHLLRAAYLNLGMDQKSDTLAQILVALTEKGGA